MNRILLCFALISLFCLSCASRKDLVYFQKVDSAALITAYENNAPKLQPGDILAISITADDIRATQPFNPISSYAGAAGTLQGTNPFIPTYTIDNNGYIDFPKLGKIKLAGKTRTEALDYLRREVGRFIVDPGVSIEVRNFKVTVLGEVRNPGTFPVNNDRITVLEALGLAGDLTINGVRKNVLVIREQNGEKKVHRIDLTSPEALNSPVYYLAQNDVIYVEPNGARIQSSKYTQNTSVFVSVASLIIGLITLIVRN